MWNKIKEAFAKTQKNLKIENQAKRTFDLAMDGIITKDNAINNLLEHHRRASSQRLQLRIVNRIREVWNR